MTPISYVRASAQKFGLRLAEAYAGLAGEVRVNAADLTSIEKFRYGIYIEELRKPLPWADHSQRRLPDPADAQAFHFTYHASDESILGCVRLHMAPQLPEGIVGQLQLQNFAARYDRPFGYVSKLMVSRTYRGAGISLALMRAMVEFGHSEPYRGEIAFFHCHPKLVPLYERTGFRRFGTPFKDPHVGAQVPMYIMGGDVTHFKRCGSDLARTSALFEIPAARKSSLFHLIPPATPSTKL